MKRLSATNLGLISSIGSFFLMGMIPAYFKQFDDVSAGEILAQRIVWSVLFLALTLILAKKVRYTKNIFKNPKTLLYLTISGALIASNWLILIWASSNEMILEVSLGRFLSPLAVVLIGIFLLSEKANTTQKIAIFMMFCAIFIKLLGFGKVPIAALLLAATYAPYCLVRKKINIHSASAIFMEMLMMVPFAVAFIIYLWLCGKSNFSLGLDDANTWLFICMGPLTLLIFVLFGLGVSRLKLSTMGFTQYISPTVGMVLAIFIYNEPFTKSDFFVFLLIWCALFIITIDSFFKLSQEKLRSWKSSILNIFKF
ncbi:MAG: EamA family transporter RarD [Campylobacteraceae bacterium]|jgi:chloramphenicol-sensitive protein RarD|nr:EamA family transporter RarD [Campylobacteraceae bacterium]